MDWFSEVFHDLGEQFHDFENPNSQGEDFSKSILNRVNNTINVLREIREGFESKGSSIRGCQPLPEIHAGYINSREFNAFCAASRERNVYCLGMPITTPLCFLEFCGHYFSREDFYPEVGNSCNKKDNSMHEYLKEQISGYDAYPSALIKSLNLVEKPLRTHDLNVLAYACLPDDPIRKKASIYFAHQLTYYVWMHEVAHMAHGHILKLGNDTAKNFRLQELQSNKYHTCSNMEMRRGSALSQLCELDADSRALRAILTQMIIGDDPIYGPLNGFECRIEIRISITVYLIMMFHKINWFELKRNWHEESTHPPSLVRAACSLAEAMNFSNRKELMKEACSRILSQLLLEENHISENAFKDVDALLSPQIYGIVDDWNLHLKKLVRTNSEGYFGMGWLEYAL